jgi:glycosyltransferase involved in cell wall biosynthesis
MLMTCIIPVYNEGPLLFKSVRSIVNQSMEDFELIIVADGASPETLSALDTLTDPRIRVIYQPNLGLSAARNRGIDEAKGEYISFIDADDSRPNWAFAEIVKLTKESPDLIICPGALQELRGEFKSFYDQYVFDQIATESRSDLRDLALTLQPQSANKIVSRRFIDRTRLRFPDGLYFEDIFFHIGSVLMANSIVFLNAPTFCYFRRYNRAQITSTHGDRRFHSIAVVKLTLNKFADQAFSAPHLTVPMLSACKTFLRWNQSELAIHRQDEFVSQIEELRSGIDSRWNQIWESV